MRCGGVAFGNILRHQSLLTKTVTFPRAAVVSARQPAALRICSGKPRSLKKSVVYRRRIVHARVREKRIKIKPEQRTQD